MIIHRKSKRVASIDGSKRVGRDRSALRHAALDLPKLSGEEAALLAPAKCNHATPADEDRASAIIAREARRIRAAKGDLPDSIEFVERAVVKRHDVARHRVYRSLCGRYRVVKSEALLGGVQVRWYAEVLEEIGGRPIWEILSKDCRTQDGAVEACRRHARQSAEGRQ